jgi:hypothetical protein
VQLFTYVTLSGELLTEERNFQDFGSALLLLFQVLTGDDWSAIMHDCMATPETSGCSAEEGNCGTAAAIPYFVSFQLLGSFVMLNLVVAVILENFTTLGMVNPELISSTDIANFKVAWAEIDPDANGFAPEDELPGILLQLPPPMGFKGKTESLRHVARYCKGLKLEVKDGEVKFQEVIDKIMKENEPKNMPGSPAKGELLAGPLDNLVGASQENLDQAAAAVTDAVVDAPRRLSAGVASVFASAGASMKAEGDKLKEKLKDSDATLDKLKGMSSKHKEPTLREKEAQARTLV